MEGCETEMSNEYILSPEALVQIQGSSKGAQPKYLDKGYWYKVNTIGYEGIAESLVSMVLACSNAEDFVTYEECTVNERNGCRSKSFTGSDEYFLSFQRLYEIYTGGNLSDAMFRISHVADRIRFVVDFIREITDLDCTNYLSKILALDMLILNTDRHFNNLGLIVNSSKKTYRSAPIFDNGNSLLSDIEKFDIDNALEDNIEHVIGQPFAANLEVQADAAGIGLKLDYTRLNRCLENLPQSRALDVLKYQVRRYKDIISIL